MIGRTLSQYKVVEKIGQGGMGEVYAAEDSRLNRKVALKVLPPDVAADPERRTRFEREAQAIAALNHPNIVTIHSVEECEGVSFIIMELVEGQTLAALIPRAGLGLAQFFNIAIQLTDALASAHQKGITHRDLKPANVMLTGDGRVKVLDFGLAKLAQPGPSDATPGATAAATITSKGAIVGTVAYMSPEQAEGKPVDARSDVFSIGIMLYEMATGERPFHGDTPVSTITSIMRDTPQPIGELKPTTPRHLGRVVGRCLTKDPDRRYQAALEVRNELEALRTEVETDPSGVLSGTMVAPPAVKRRKPMLMAGLGALAVVALVAAAIVLWPGSGDKGSATPPPAAADVQPSVAVLPFVNLSDDKANEYFSDGLAEELLNLLAQVRGLHVAARTSSFHFKGHTGNVAEVARQLNVATILEGSVRKADNRVRVTAQLVNAADGFPLWSDNYDRQLDDIFGIQEEIATQVADALKVTLLGEDMTRLAKRPTENMQAYDAYLLGQQRMARRRSDSLQEAAEYFQRAIDLDPQFALAYAYLANTYWLMGSYATLSTEEVITKTEPLIERALELDDELGEAYAALANLRSEKMDMPGTEAAFKRAIELNPNYALVYMRYASHVRERGDKEEAQRLLNKSIELDPMAPVANANAAYWLLGDNKPREALARFRHVIEIDPEYPTAHSGMATVQLDYLDQTEAGLKSLRTAVELDPGDLNRRLGLGWRYNGLGRYDEALETFQATIDRDPDFTGGYVAMAGFHGGKGRLDEAVRWHLQALERDPDDFDLQVDMAERYLGLGDEESAIEWLDAAKNAHPDNPVVPFFPAWIHQHRNELDEFEAWVLKAAPSFPGELDFELTCLDLRAGRFAEARARTAKRYPELADGPDPQVHRGNLHAAVDVAQVLLSAGERQRGELLLRKSEEFLDTKDEAVILNQYLVQPVEVYAWQGRIDDALAALRRAIDHGLQLGYSDRLDPAFLPLRDDPRYEAMMAEMRADADRMHKILAAEGLANP